jgi:DUF971 family protein
MTGLPTIEPVRSMTSSPPVPSPAAAKRGSSPSWPTELRLHKDRKTLTVAFEDGAHFDLPAEYLRVKSPSAEVQGHSHDERKTVGGKQNVAILEVEPVGNYAVRLTFDDMHSTGIYSWDYLHELGDRQSEYWRGYLDDLAKKGLTRLLPGQA